MVNRMIHTPSFLSNSAIQEYWSSTTSPVGIAAGGWYFGVGGTNTYSMYFDSQTGWTIGWRMKWTGPAGGTTTLLELADINGVQHCTLRLAAATGIIDFTRAGTQLLASSTPLSMNVEYYLELQVTIADSGGVAIFKVDGVTDSVINSSSLDTRNGGLASAARVTFYAQGNAAVYLKDIYINDNSGGVDDTFWGPITVMTTQPIGAGISSWTPSAGSNYQNVDDATTDGDSTYNETSTNGHVDTYAMSNSTYSAGTIKGVEWAAEHKRTEASASARLAPVLRIGGTDYVGSDFQPRMTYRFSTQRYRVNPATSSAWTFSDIDGMEAGIKRTAT